MSPNLQYICELCFSGKGKYVWNTTHFLDYFSDQGPIWLSCIGVKFGPPWRQQNAMIDWSFKIWKYFTNISQMMTSQVCNVFHNEIHSDQVYSSTDFSTDQQTKPGDNKIFTFQNHDHVVSLDEFENMANRR